MQLVTFGLQCGMLIMLIFPYIKEIRHIPANRFYEVNYVPLFVCFLVT